MVSKNNKLKMLKRLFPITLLTFMATVVFAQNPHPAGIATPTSLNQNQPESILACAPGAGNEAEQQFSWVIQL